MKNSKLKSLMGLGLSLAMVISLAACGKSEEKQEEGEETTREATEGTEETTEETAEETTESHEPVALRFMWWGGDERHEATVKAIEAFEAKYDWITIEPEYGSMDGYYEKMTTQLAAGSAPDIIQMGTGWLPGMIETSPDALVDFTQYSIDLSNYDSNFLEQNGYFNGGQYGLPTGIAGYNLIYNKTLADKIGIKFPDSKEATTWDTLLELGKQVQEYSSEAYLLDLEGYHLYACVLRPYLVQMVGAPMIANGELTYTEEQLVEVLTYIQALYENGVIVPMQNIATYTNDTFYTDPKWVSGDTYVASFISASTAEPVSAACPDSEFAIAYAPVMEGAKDDGYYADCPNYFCVAQCSENKEEAVMFLDWLINSEEAAEILKTVRSVPATTVGQKVCEDLGELDGIAKEAVDILQNNYKGVNQMGLSTEDEFKSICTDMLELIAYGQGTPEEIAKEYMVIMQEYVDSRS